MSGREFKFYGLVLFSGRELLPGNIPLDTIDLRKWAHKKGYIYDPEFQLLLTERLEELEKCFSSDDRLMVALSIDKAEGETYYFEYPYLSVKSLIQKEKEIELIYWQMKPNRWDRDGKALQFGEVMFSFLFPGCGEEICSLSSAKRVIEKFNTLLDKLSNAYTMKVFKDGSKKITVNGEIRAKFFKDGRLFDVELTAIR